MPWGGQPPVKRVVGPPPCSTGGDFFNSVGFKKVGRLLLGKKNGLPVILEF